MVSVGAHSHLLTLKTEKKQGGPFHLEHDREQVGGKEQDKDRLVSPRGAKAGEQGVHRHRGGVRLQGGERGHCLSLSRRTWLSLRQLTRVSSFQLTVHLTLTRAHLTAWSHKPSVTVRLRTAV